MPPSSFKQPSCAQLALITLALSPKRAVLPLAYKRIEFKEKGEGKK